MKGTLIPLYTYGTELSEHSGHFKQDIPATEEQLEYLCENIGLRPLGVVAEECGLGWWEARTLMLRLQRKGRIKHPPGRNWRKTMQEAGYEFAPNEPRRLHGGVPVLRPQVHSEKAGNDPKCVHHRDCVRVGDGLEKQTCRKCGDVLIIRLRY